MADSILKPPSAEQERILTSVMNGLNVAVNAVAGSGKTSTILHVGNACRPTKTLVLTYNARLKEESRIRVVTAGLGSVVEVHSYHSFGYKYYGSDCMRDTGIESVLTENRKPKIPIPTFGIIVLDELQDATNTLFRFFLKGLSDIHYSQSPPQLLLLGDERQSIYRFKLSDERFLTLSERLFHGSVLRSEWARLPLSTSFRVNGNMAAFVNQCMLKDEMIKVAKPPGTSVQYLVGGAFKANFWIVKYLLDLYRKGISFDDMIILAPTVNVTDAHPLKTLVKLLSEKKVMVQVTNDLEGKVSEEVIRGKLLVTTFHQSKGIERKVVIVFNFDATYFTYIARKDDPNQCPNVFYVACTRATEHLIVVAEQFVGEHLPFLDRVRVEQLASQGVVEIHNVAGEKYFSQRPAAFQNDEKKKEVPVTRLIHWLPELLSQWCISKLQVIKISTGVVRHFLEGTAQFENDKGEYSHSEHVYELNGLAIPAMLEQESKAVISMSQLLRDADTWAEGDEVSRVVQNRYAEFQKRVPTLVTVPHFLELACIYNAHVTGFINKLSQITHFNWLDEVEVSKCVSFLKSLVKEPENAKYEHNLIFQCPRHKLIVWGILDILTDDTVFEIKCVSELSSMHFIQLAMYAWLWCKLHPNNASPREFKLVNVTDGSIWQIAGDEEALDAVADRVLNHFLHPPRDEREDEQFVDEIRTEIASYFRTSNLSTLYCGESCEMVLSQS